MKVNEPFMCDLRADQQAHLMLRQFHVLPQYRDLVHEGVGACKPEANAHCSKELKEIEMPQKVLAPVLVAIG